MDHLSFPVGCFNTSEFMKRIFPLTLLALAASAYAGGPVLSATSYGQIRFGDTLGRAEKLLKEKTPEIADPDERLCRQVSFRAYPEVGFMVEEGVITRAESSVAVPTSLGLTIGASLEAVKKRFPSVVVEPHQYDPDGHYLILKSPGGKTALIMEEGHGKVTAVRGGLEPSVEYVEGCL
jgi:hypothetical protein